MDLFLQFWGAAWWVRGQTTSGVVQVEALEDEPEKAQIAQVAVQELEKQRGGSATTWMVQCEREDGGLAVM